MNTLKLTPDGQTAEPYEGDIPDPARAGQARAAAVGSEFKHQALEWIKRAGARVVHGPHNVGAYNIEAVVCGANGQNFIVLAPRRD